MVLRYIYKLEWFKLREKKGDRERKGE